MKRDVESSCLAIASRASSSNCAPKFFEQFPAVDSLQFAQLRETGGHRQRISGQRSGLIHRAVRRKLVHDFGASAERADRQTAADHFSKRQSGRV